MNAAETKFLMTMTAEGNYYCDDDVVDDDDVVAVVVVNYALWVGVVAVVRP